jgi:hypothetical protein
MLYTISNTNINGPIHPQDTWPWFGPSLTHCSTQDLPNHVALESKSINVMAYKKWMIPTPTVLPTTYPPKVILQINFCHILSTYATEG